MSDRIRGESVPYTPIPREAWGPRLRAARLATGRWPTVRSAADALGMEEVYLTQLETRSTVPSAATVHKLVQVLGIDPAAIFAPATESVDKRTA